MPRAVGERVSQSGIYKVIHQDHRQPHEATLRKGEVFPACRICRTGVTFEFLRTLGEFQPDHIGYDPDFVDVVVKKTRPA